MTQDRQYRHELKYKISYPDYLAMRSRLRPVMKADPHAAAGGRYLVRSVYFDNLNDKALCGRRSTASRSARNSAFVTTTTICPISSLRRR